MKILDVFSWIPARKLSIEQIEEIFLNSCKGIVNNQYSVVYEIPENVRNNIIECKSEQLREGNNVAYILQESAVVAFVGYKC